MASAVVPITEELKQDFLSKIREGHWRLNECIPTERELMHDYRASRNAVRNALKALERESILLATRGSGRRVIAEPPRRSLALGLLLRGGEFGAGGQGDRIFRQLTRSTETNGDHLVTFSINTAKGRLSSEQDDDLPIAAMDGLLVLAHQYLFDDIQRLARRKPVVTLNHDATIAGVPSFFVDFGFHAALAVQELHQRGHRRIALLYEASPFHAPIRADMQRGFALAHRFLGLAYDPALIYRTPLTRQAGAELYHRLRDQHPDVTALVSYGSEPLIGMAEAASRRGAHLPEQISTVCAVDLSDLPGSPPFGFAHFRCPIEQMVDEAADALRQAIQGRSTQPLDHPYRGEFQEGESLRAIAASR